MKGQSTHNGEALTEMLSIGFAAARDSFSFLTGEQHAVSALVDLITNSSSAFTAHFTNGDKLYVLESELQGEVHGKQYLVLKADHANGLTSKFGYGLASDTKDGDMARAFLLEVCNIVAASAISHFANRSKLRMFGSVPTLSIIEASESAQFFKRLALEAPISGHYCTTFTSANENKQALCSWLLSSDLLNDLSTVSE